MLAPWKKLHALRTFFMPQLTFALNTAVVNKGTLHELDLVMKRYVKCVLNLPQRASAKVVSLPPSWGEAKLVPLNTFADLYLG